MLYQFEHYVYEDLCGDPYFGKTGKIRDNFIVDCSDVKAEDLLNKLNKANRSYYAREPIDEYDDDCADEDYWRCEPYKLNVTPIKEIIEKYKL